MKSDWKNIHYNLLVGNDTGYGQWNSHAFKIWYEGMTNLYKK